METPSQSKVSNTSVPEAEVGSNSNDIIKTTSDNATVFNASHNKIETRWFEERRRQANMGFNITICLWAATSVFGIGAGISVYIGNISAATATAALGLSTGVASTRLFKLSNDANERLDKTARNLLDNE